MSVDHPLDVRGYDGILAEPTGPAQSVIRLAGISTPAAVPAATPARG